MEANAAKVTPSGGKSAFRIERRAVAVVFDWANWAKMGGEGEWSVRGNPWPPIFAQFSLYIGRIRTTKTLFPPFFSACFPLARALVAPAD